MLYSRICCVLLLVLLLSGGIPACAQKEGQVSVAFYNCENFFDTNDNPAKEDDDFTPNGKYRYTQKVYEQKLHNIATVIQAMPGSDGPAVIGMAEVENSTVLNDLVRQPEITRRSYKYQWFDGPDPRGINVALLYNPKHFRVLKSEPVHVDLTSVNARSRTRDILYVYGILDADTVHILVCHWPSKRGDEEASEQKRSIAARTSSGAIRLIQRQHPGARIILMGDLNDNPNESAVAQVLGASPSKAVDASGLYDPWADIYATGQGTEVFQHHWNLFDQIIVSGTFLRGTPHHLHYDHAEIFKPDFIIDHYKGHEGEPKRSFVGTHWINGFSDHFPVVLYLSKN